MDTIEAHKIYGLGTVNVNRTKLARIMADLGLSDWTIELHLNSFLMAPATRYEEKKVVIRSFTYFLLGRITGFKTASLAKLLARECCHAVQGSASRRRGILGGLFYYGTHAFHPVARDAKKWTKANRHLFEDVITLHENETEAAV